MIFRKAGSQKSSVLDLEHELQFEKATSEEGRYCSILPANMQITPYAA